MLMGSLGDEMRTKKKAMWIYPKVLGYNPPERWGHSACFSHGLLYVFGGCCGGLHFSDVLTLNIRTMTWTAFATTGRGPGPRDSHTAVLVRNKMIVFGGTNGSHKVNDLHILDLATREWSMPNYQGTPPSPRESHTATVMYEDKMVIFGGSGEGEGNYLNDLHVLDLGTMKWTYIETVRGDWPVPRDSHSAVTVANKLIVYGGDSGDRYHGDVDVFDLGTLTWSRLLIDGCCPGARAGHASITIGSRIYMFGGVGDKHYYNDVWVLDISSCCSWTQLDVGGPQPQGRFSHTAVSMTGSDITIYGGCGEDEHPLKELLVIQFPKEGVTYGHHNMYSRRLFTNIHWNREKRRSLRAADALQPLRFNSETLHPKRRKTSRSNDREDECDQEEYSLSLSSRHSSSPSWYDPNQIPIRRNLSEPSVGVQGLHFFKHSRRNRINSSSSIHQIQEQLREHNVQHLPMLEPKVSDSLTAQNHLVGASVVGKVDGAFDSGLLMTAVVNGKIFRGVLFSPGNVTSREPQCRDPIVVAQAAVKPSDPPLNQSVKPLLSQEDTAHPSPEAKLRGDLEGLVLTLGNPGHMHKDD